MFTSKAKLVRLAKSGNLARFDYLQGLVNEYQDTVSAVARKQILANLGNFSYDPVNYEYLRALCVVDLFFDALLDEDEEIVEHAAGGLCNICLDPQSKATIAEPDNVRILTSALHKCSREETVISIMTTIILIYSHDIRALLVTRHTLDDMEQFAEQTESVRLQNLARIFLHDCAARTTTSNMS